MDTEQLVSTRRRTSMDDSNDTTHNEDTLGTLLNDIDKETGANERTHEPAKPVRSLLSYRTKLLLGLLSLLVIMYVVFFLFDMPLQNSVSIYDDSEGSRNALNMATCLWQPQTLSRLEPKAYIPIPHIIHQSWKTKTLPLKFQTWQESWIENHKDWKYILWTDEDNMKLCEDHFPWMLERFKSFPKTINRADTARYMYMYLHGGFYADLDMECLKPHDLIARKGGVVVPLMSRDYAFHDNIPNAWMGSAPGHPFWLHLLRMIRDRPIDGRIESMSGPTIMYQALKEFEQKYYNESMPPITYMAKELILPYDWHDTKDLISICSAQRDTIDPDLCKEKVDPEHKAFAITYWSHSWGDGDGKISTPFRRDIGGKR
ncbi:hypothetical protein BATDEDRAFT_92119 [Batrachochytrium dendrobatidis JAM81]|uniref:Uncharacterized protein n=2 Tax=Batrachochytrium dendrobatidis TaxID=109871 RepID=F4PD05_BATDJ|nr:uncharacterized protein BATDEDRAFT_92119 [Batrachochytrium dendrobatidis JAM81]EGF76953.1 hypothetical protein BATDEDRAFT_92119 [Batrachochytrium dendrobatidis JAM81]KAJ8331014.1 hypothetical protein O5D80_001024 [Batrachochytrium dendrobatidis]KAK5672418.1 hypothetical protein QVD99_001181 [Batrachochytrium dendrobatidis]OAJ45032.1 hypothetical protein BDEG_28200 [Batrachochytrium dendrobatidis JEL423]|eukprot:XP_006682514.1 hypothetical protein BATDEDRAFT_92119 [Batrachochytrium dendrobatidis JAM81]